MKHSQSSKSPKIDFTKGSLWKQLILFFIPLLAGSLFQQLYITVDAIMVGQFIGKDGLASIESVHSLIRLPVNFFVGLSTGATIIISQCFGSRDNQQLSKTVHTAVAFSFIGGLMLSIAGVILAPYCIRLMEVPEEISQMTLSYLRIYFSGLAFSMLYNIGAGILRAVGDSKTPFYYLIASSIINITLDFLFVGIFHWGVSGAALSTVIAQIVSAALIIIELIKTKLECKLILKKIKFHSSIFKSIIFVGLPIGLQSSLFPIANMTIQANINGMGTDNIAAWALCSKLDFLVWLIADSFAATISTVVAQNYGALNFARLRKGVHLGMLITSALITILSIILYFFCEPLGHLFIRSEDFNVIPIAGEFMRFLAPLYLLYVFGEILSGAIRGTGETVKPMILSLFGTCICRILWISLVVPHNPTMMTILASYPVSWALASLLFIIYYYFLPPNPLRR